MGSEHGPASLPRADIDPPDQNRYTIYVPSGDVPMAFTLKVNGKTSTVDVPPDMPLLWVLRDVLDLKGTKFGCGIAQCGACTVHVKGTPTRSCSIPVSAAVGLEITTIEGLSADGTHPL